MTSVHAGIAHQPPGQMSIVYLPLEDVSVKVSVVDVSSHIVLTQAFYNPSNEPTGRAKYVFPLPANAAICAFELELEDGSMVIGEVKEKEEAALIFGRAVDQGKTTALVERVTDDIFTISLGSIPATMRLTARLVFVMDLLDEGLQDHVRLQLPMHVAERYGEPPAALNHASAADSQTRLHINVDIQTSDAIYDIRCPTHQGVTFRRYKTHSGHRSPRRMSATWESSEFLTSDFVLTIYANGLDKPRCFAEVLGARDIGDGAGSTIALQLTLVPKFFAPKIPSQEYIFIIDRSGSMANSPIETAKRTLTMLLRLLPSIQTTFNIFSFGSTFSSLWPSSRALNSTSLSEATAHVASMSADMGGTEIPSALEAAFASRGGDRPAAVFLLTDGQIYSNDRLNPWEIISNAIQGSPPHAPVRLFVLGIGTGVSSDVCDSLARQGNGESMFALTAEDIVGKCARLLNASRSKNIESINIDWGHNVTTPTSPTSTHPPLPAGIVALAPPQVVQQSPHVLTRIFSGIRFTVFAIASFTTVPKSVKLMTKLEGETNAQELNVAVTTVKPFRDTDTHLVVSMLHVLAARKLIMELNDGVGPLPAPASNDAPLATNDDLRKAGIVRLGLTYQLVSKHTSFVAVRQGGERAWSRRRRESKAWARSRLGQASASFEAAEGSPAPPPEGSTFFDNLIDGATSFVMSIFGFLIGPGAANSRRSQPRSTPSTSRSQSHHRPTLPGAFDDEDNRGRRPTRVSSPVQQTSPSRHSASTSPSLRSLDGSTSCSDCWTSSRSPSPRPRFLDPIERAPSPAFEQDPNVQASVLHPRPNANPNPKPTRRVPISQDVYDLFRHMDVDGSFSTSPLLVRLVGAPILAKADEQGIDKKIWATAVAVAYMRIHVQSEPDLLDLVSEKAREFVDEAVRTRGGGDGVRFERMVQEAERLLSSSAGREPNGTTSP